MMQPLTPVALEGKCQGLVHHIYGWARSFECCRSFECQFAMLRSFEVRIAKLKFRSFGYFSKQTCGAKRRNKLVPVLFIHHCSKGCLFQPQIDEIVSKLRSKLRIVSSKLRMPVFGIRTQSYSDSSLYSIGVAGRHTSLRKTEMKQ